MRKFLSERKLNIAISALAVIVMWVVWIIAYYATGNDYVIPSFQNTFLSLGKIFASSRFWVAFGNTAWRTLLAFALSFVLAATLAVLGVFSKKFAAFITPVMVFLRTLPTLAVILILLIWTNPRIAPVIVTILVICPMIHAQFVAAIGGIDGGLKEMAQVYGIGKKERLFKIYLPAVSPNILAQTGANISLSLKIMVSAEVLASTYRSLGGMMQEARLNLEMANLAALTLITVLIGLIIDLVFSIVVKKICKWNGKEDRRD